MTEFGVHGERMRSPEVVRRMRLLELLRFGDWEGESSAIGRDGEQQVKWQVSFVLGNLKLDVLASYLI